MKVGVLLVAATLALLALALGLSLKPLLWPMPLPTRPVIAEAQLGAVRLRYEPRYARPPEARASQAENHLELVAAMPDFTPAGDALDRLPPETLVFLTIEPAGTTLDPSERPQRLYARFLDSDVWSHPGGLIMRRFMPESPYEREDLYMAPPEGSAFFARCTRPPAIPDGLPGSCISEMRVAGLDIQMRFSPEQLSSWERMVAGARLLVGAPYR
jgi:hypothetical protein